MDQFKEKAHLLKRDEETVSCSQDNPTDATTKDKLPVTQSSKVRKHRKRRSIKAKNKRPARPLTAYNIFFKEERVRWLAEIEGKAIDADGIGKSKFTQLGFEMGRRWKKLTPEGRVKYEELAKKDVERYQKEMEIWLQPQSSPKHGKDSKNPPEEIDSDECQDARRLTNSQPSVLGTQTGVMGVTPHDAMIQQLLGSQYGGATLRPQLDSHRIPFFTGQLSDREATLRQRQLQELVNQQSSKLSQLLSYGLSLDSSALTSSANILPGLSGDTCHAIQSLSALEQQLWIQRIRERELRHQLATLEDGLSSQQQFQLQSLLGQSNIPLSNLNWLTMQPSSSNPSNLTQESFPTTMNSEVLANLSLREKLQLLLQLNQRRY